jgi:hypothetical protein
MKTTIYVEARCPHKAIPNATLKELWSGRKPIVKLFKILEFPTYALKLEQTRESKLEPKNTKCTFVGYNTNSKAYKLINVLREKLIFNRDIIFNKIVTSSLHPFEKTMQVVGASH